MPTEKQKKGVVMKIYGINIHGGKNNSDIVIHASGEGFNELAIFCDVVLEHCKSTSYIEGSTYDRVLKVAKELRQMMNPMNDNPKRLFITS